MKVYDTKNIRNIVLLGHASSGKTTLAETMLFEGGVISRRGTVQEKNTVSDHYLIEKERGNSVFASLMHVDWRGNKINIIDTPGYDDFVGEVVSGLKVADTAVIVLNAQQGVEVGTELIWEYTEKMQTPVVFVVNQLDHEKANYEQTLEQARKRFGNKVVPMQYPINIGEGFDTIVDILKMTMYKFPADGGKPEKMPIPDNEKAKAEEMHQQLVEAVAEYDEDLMEAFFEKGSLTEEELTKGMKLSMLNHQIFPLFCTSATKNMGSGRIMGFLNDIAPAPIDRPVMLTNGDELACDSSADAVVFFYKTLSEPRLGEVSYFKVYSGTINVGDELYNERSSVAERLSQINVVNGKQRDKAETLKAGDIGAIVKLKDTKSNDTLAKKGSGLVVEPIDYPAPRIRIGIGVSNAKDVEKMMDGLRQINKEDPTVIVEQSKELRQIILSTQGELHLNIIKYRLEKLYNLQLEFEKPRIPYRETLTKMTNASYRHKKQSGGSGQFAEVHMRVEPYTEGMPEPDGLNVRSKQNVELKWGGTLAFYWCIVGGSIDAKYQNAIIKGITNTMENGPMTGSYVRDVRVCVYDGKMHAVDSNDMAFQLAATQCFKQAFRECGPVILEPIYDIEILTPGDVMGDIMGDLQSRNATIMGMDAERHYQKISAKAPLRDLYKYSSTLRALSKGRSKHTRAFADYQSVPREVQEKLVAEHSREAVEA